ncbi:distal tail protein Dit [Exiguobacterium aurantiacum]|uniref:distal tail protein Dit n=1 Tax=Exiguobacterium aurantiacum TaxID=33987 RepID=UPI00384A4F6C
MKIWFDEVEITELFDVVDVSRDIMPERTNLSMAIPSKHGEYFTGHRYGLRTVSVDFLVVADGLNSLQAIKKGMAFMLDIDRPAKLIFDDEPDKLLYAVLDGQTSVEEILKEGRGTLTFICHDPFYYATTEKVFQGDASDKLIIDNLGTAPTSPRFELEFPGSCGFVSLVSPSGVIQIGEPSQVDVVPVPDSERLVKTDMESTSGWTINGTSAKTLTAGTRIDGTIGVNSGGYALRPSGYGTTTGTGWHGPSLRRSLPQSTDGTSSAQYFEVTAFFEFKSNKGGQVVNNDVKRDIDAEQKGTFEFNIMDEDNNFIAGIRLQDSTVYHDMTVPEFWVGTKRVWQESLKKPAPKREKFTYKEQGKVKTGYRDVYASDVGKWNDMYGVIKIKKFKNRITFDLQKLGSGGKVVARKTQTVYLTSTQNTKKARHIQSWFGKYPNNPVIDAWSLSYVGFTKHNTEEEYDIPNTFKQGDKLVVDCNDSQVYLNGALFMEQVDIGSEFFEVVSGQTEVQLMHSRFGGLRPSFKATITEKWL